VLLNGVNHVAILTKDIDRLRAFYAEVFESTVSHQVEVGDDGATLTMIDVGPFTELNVFHVPGNTEPDRQTPMLGRGRIDHVGLQASSLEAFDTIRRRLLDRNATSGFVTDFGPSLSLFFRDPDGLEGEVLVANPNHVPGRHNPPGTPTPGYEVENPAFDEE
jgi:catechol 2,3-dioxygenase-like lactoylglutathione lyase family enzyme